MYTCSVTALVRCWLALAVCQTSARDLLDQHVQRIIGNFIFEESHFRNSDIQKYWSSKIKTFIYIATTHPPLAENSRIGHDDACLCYRLLSFSEKDSRNCIWNFRVVSRRSYLSGTHVPEIRFFGFWGCFFPFLFHFWTITKIHLYCWNLRFIQNSQLECVYAESL